MTGLRGSHDLSVLHSLTLQRSSSLLPSHSLSLCLSLMSALLACWICSNVDRRCEQGKKVAFAPACVPLFPLRLTLPPLLHNLLPSYLLSSLARGLDCLLQRHVFPGRLRVSRCDSYRPLALWAALCLKSCGLEGFASAFPLKSWLSFQTAESVCSSNGICRIVCL